MDNDILDMDHSDLMGPEPIQITPGEAIKAIIGAIMILPLAWAGISLMLAL